MARLGDGLTIQEPRRPLEVSSVLWLLGAAVVGIVILSARQAEIIGPAPATAGSGRGAIDAATAWS
jgi:hypothetical protein